MTTSISGTPRGAGLTLLAPAKVNLTLHVTGRLANGYHTLDSLVVFAGLGDRLTVTPGTGYSLTVSGPLADGVPTDDSNLCIKAARLAGHPATIELEKFLPSEAGIGGGSADAAAVLRALARLSGHPQAIDSAPLGADVPVCLLSHAARMQGIGEIVSPVRGLPPLPAVLVNPRIAVATPPVFAAMEKRDNPPMPENLPAFHDVPAVADWLREMRNDLEAPAIALKPGILDALRALERATECLLSRMSGSGATCFGLFPTDEVARNAAKTLKEQKPDWWVEAVTLT